MNPATKTPQAPPPPQPPQEPKSVRDAWDSILRKDGGRGK